MKSCYCVNQYICSLGYGNIPCSTNKTVLSKVTKKYHVSTLRFPVLRIPNLSQDNHCKNHLSHLLLVPQKSLRLFSRHL